MTTWQVAFLAVGSPGLLLACVALVFPDPTRGLSEGVGIERLRFTKRGAQPGRLHRFDGQFFVHLLAVWYHVFVVCLCRGALLVQGFSHPGQGIAGRGRQFHAGDQLSGSLGGGNAGRCALAESASRRDVRRVLHCSRCVDACRDSRSFCWRCIRGPTPLVVTGLSVAVGVTFLSMVPCYIIISSVTMPNMRGLACGVALAAVNLLGAIWSPTLMGWVADTFGQKDSMATGFGQALERSAPVPWRGQASTPRI